MDILSYYNYRGLRNAVLDLDTLRDNEEYKELMKKQMESEDKLSELLENIKGGKELLEQLFLDNSGVTSFTEKYCFDLGFKSHDFMGELKTVKI